MYHAKIPFGQLAVLHFLVENAQRLCRLCGDDDAAGVAVNAVDERGREGRFLIGIIRALFIEIPLDAGDERINKFTVIRMTKQPRLFVQQQHIVVFIENVELF